MMYLTKQEAYDIGYDHGFTMAQESGVSGAGCDGWDGMLYNADPTFAREKLGWDLRDTSEEAKQLLAEYCRGCQAGADDGAPQKEYHCGCGRLTGERCNWNGPLSEMVVVEYMPEYLRQSHIAARNSGSYPFNGSERVAVQTECAESLKEWEDEQWFSITNLDPADYVQ